MTWEEIYQRALRQTHTDTVDYTNEDANSDMDLRYQELIDAVVSVSKSDYFWDRWVTDTVVNQSEYVAEKLGISPDDLDIKKINKVFIKYNSSQVDFTPVEYRTPTSLVEHPDYYKTNQSTSDPFFYIQDTSIFLYPSPAEAITGALELFVIHKPAAIDTTTSEANIELPYQFHKLISDWLRIDVFLSQGKINEAQSAQAVYDAGIRSMVSIMKERYWQAIKKNFKNNLNEYR